MFDSQKHVFWQAFLITILIFGIGILFGFVLENWRAGKIESFYQQSEINLLDIKLQTDIYSSGNFNCDEAQIENLNFAEKIYNEAKLMERYEKASELSDKLANVHRKYDILRANLLLNSMKIKEKCNSSYYDVVYIYKYNNPSLDTRATQNTFSKLLLELKNKKGSEILLIPMAGDNDVASINLIMSEYDVSKDELPLIIINGKIKISDLENINDLLKYFK